MEGLKSVEDDTQGFLRLCEENLAEVKRWIAGMQKIRRMAGRGNEKVVEGLWKSTK